MLWQNMRHGYLQLHPTLQQHHFAEAAANQVGTPWSSASAMVLCLNPWHALNT